MLLIFDIVNFYEIDMEFHIYIYDLICPAPLAFNNRYFDILIVQLNIKSFPKWLYEKKFHVILMVKILHELSDYIYREGGSEF